MTKLKDLLIESQGKMKNEIMKDHSKDVVVTAAADKSGYTSDDRAAMSEFFRAVASHDPKEIARSNDVQVKDYESKGIEWRTDSEYKTKAQTVGTIGSGTSGGVLVPTILRDQIIAKQYYISPMRQISTVINDMPASFDMPFDSALPTVAWTGEGVAITPSSVTFGKKNLTPYKLAGLDTFTSEVLADAAVSPDLQNVVADRFATALSLGENAAFVSGTGSAQPFGFRSGDISPTVLATNTTAGNLAYTDVVQQYFTLATAYRNQAVWVTSSTGIQLLDGIKDTTGRPIFMPGYTGVKNETLEPATLYGRPVYIVDEIPTNLGAGTNETQLWFGVFKNYFIGTRGGIRMETGTNGTDFAQDQISWRIIERIAGRPFLDVAWTSKNIK